MGNFLTQFDAAADKNTLLFDWILDNHNELFVELQAERPILEFPSKQPGNLDLKEERGEGIAYLLTSQVDVKYALSHFSMKPYFRSGLFVLTIDEGNGHGNARQAVARALCDPNFMHRIDDSINETWDEFVAGKHAPEDRIRLSVLEFARKVALRFTGKYFGIPEKYIFPPSSLPASFAGLDTDEHLQRWSGEAYQDFIWKIHARHFVERPTDTAPLKKIVDLIGVIMLDPVPGSMIARLMHDPGPFDKMGTLVNIIGCIQGLVDNVTTGVCYTINQFFEHQKIEEAKRANETALKQMMREALRLDAPSPFLPRRNLKGGSVPPLGTVPLGHNFACAIGAAMTDPAKVTDPLTFDHTRVDDPDMRFSYGLHECVGKHLGEDLMRCTVAKVLTLNDLNRVDPIVKQWGWIVKKMDIVGEPCDRPETPTRLAETCESI